MNEKGKVIRQAVALGLSAAMLVLWISVPLLEHADLVDEPVVESEHNPSTCPTAHDHTVRYDAMAASEVYERVKAFLEKDLKQRLRTFSVVFSKSLQWSVNAALKCNIEP